MAPTDTDFIQSAVSIRSLVMGFQMIPPFAPQRPEGIGCEPQHRKTWSYNGQPVEELMDGTVFTDGACTKVGPPTWTRTGWAVVKVSPSGELLASVSGQVGRALPQSSAASEYVAALVASGFPKITLTYSDYKNLDELESIPIESALHPKGMYSGIRRRIRGGMAPQFRIKHCKGHVNVDSCRGGTPRPYFGPKETDTPTE